MNSGFSQRRLRPMMLLLSSLGLIFLGAARTEGQQKENSRPTVAEAAFHLATLEEASRSKHPPNVLFIAMDDLNDWIGSLQGHPQTLTPNLDRLAQRSVLFSNAHCPAPACNPSRTAIFSGRAPNRSGLYDNRQAMREVLPDAILIPEFFRNHGYSAIGSGKLLHYFIDARSWDSYFPSKETENPLPPTHYPSPRPVNLPVGGPWQYVETDWAALDVDDEEFGGDWSVVSFMSEQLQGNHDKPLFLGCGIYRPHEPWFVPKKYFEPFPLETIKLPPGYKQDDLDDVPTQGVRMARNRYFEHIQAQDQWKQGIQGYLASIHFADAMLGRLLDTLEASPFADNTIVVLWSDHGWQLGEKEHWQKYTPWRAVTRVPLMVYVPPGLSPILPEGTPKGLQRNEPVNLLSLFPTLAELCDLPIPSTCDGPSLVPLLSEENEPDWPHDSVTFLQYPGSFSMSGSRFRYIHYQDGGEELYDIETDPFEWNNLIKRSEYTEILTGFRTRAPRKFAEKVAASIESLSKLSWVPITDEQPPSSRPDGSPFRVHFENRRDAAVELMWVARDGNLKSYGLIDSKARKPQQTRPGAVWLIRDAESKQHLGYFRVQDRTAQAIVPSS